MIIGGELRITSGYAVRLRSSKCLPTVLIGRNTIHLLMLGALVSEGTSHTRQTLGDILSKEEVLR